MSEDFSKKFPNKRVILDATEILLKKPSDVNDQSVNFTEMN